MKKPNFFIIGAPSCGTTSIAAYLADHPQIFMSKPKELSYFNNPYYPISEYEKIFAKAGPQHKAVGEATAMYLYHKQAVPNILNYNPNAQFIAIVRNPVERLYSAYLYGLKIGQYVIDDIDTYWCSLPDNLDNSLQSKTPCKYFFKLGEQIERLYDTVPAKNKILIILFDDLKNNPKEVYENILAFLEIPSDNRTDFSIHNEGAIVRYPLLNYLLGQANQSVRKILKIKPHTSLTKGLGGWVIHRLNTKKVSKPPLPENFRKELIQYFQEDIQKLSRLIKKDLSHWQ